MSNDATKPKDEVSPIGYTVYAIIPARVGSKAVPKKNIKLLGGYPLIAFSIVAAQLSREIGRVVVSTDSEEIGDIAKRFGAEVPFLRPPDLARDNSTNIDFIHHAIGWFDEREGNQPDILVQLLPTTPLREPAIIDAAIRTFLASDEATSLRTVHELPEPPQKMMGIKDGFLEGLFPDDPRPEYYNLPRQLFPKAYLPNSYADIFRTTHINRSGMLFGNRILAFVTDATVEIDQPEEFAYLEYLVERHDYPIHQCLRSGFPDFPAA